MAAAANRSTLNVPIRLISTTRRNSAKSWGPCLPTIRAAPKMPAHCTTPDSGPSDCRSGVDRPLDVVFAGHVGANELGRRTQFGRQRFAGSGIDVGQQHAATGRGQRACHAGTQARGRSGHEKRISCDLHLPPAESVFAVEQTGRRVPGGVPIGRS